MATAWLSADDRLTAHFDARRWFAQAIGCVVLLSFVLASFAPVGFSIATVFLFAGPHNWFEGRYMISRMPAKWGPLAGYFLFGIGGVILLTGAFAALPLVMGESIAVAHIALATWNTGLVAWICSLAIWRSRQNPRRDWSWIVPLGLALVAVNWIWPWAWSLCLVYAHPLVAMTFFDREIARRKAQWQSLYRGGLAAAALCLVTMFMLLGSAADLPGEDILSLQITRHAGAGILQGVSTHFLVAAHTFLEMLHYAIWILAMPLLCVKAAPWNLSRSAPLARRSMSWRVALLGLVGVGAGVVLLLWGGFVANYPATRDLYFTVAMLHVLAEVPFLLRLL
jgi:hypothetical protein